MRIFFVDQEERSIIHRTQSHKQIANLRDGIHGRVVAMRCRIGELLQQILIILLLQQHNHVLEKQNTKLNGALSDRQQAVVSELVVGQVDVLKLVWRFFVI